MNWWRLTIVACLVVGCSPQPDAAPARKQPHLPLQHTAKPDAPAGVNFNWKPDDGTVDYLQFSPDDNRLVVSFAPEDKKVKRKIVVLCVRDAKEEYSFESRLFPTSICFSPDGSHLAVLAINQLTIHDIDNRKINVRIDRKSFEPEILSLGFTGDGTILVGAGLFLDPKTNQVAWNTTTGESVPKPDGVITWHGLGLSQDGTMFFSGGPGPTPRIFKTDRSGRITYCFRDELSIAVAFTPDSKNLVTIHQDGLLVIWEIKPTDNENAKQLVSQAGFDGCQAFAVSHNRKWIAVAEKDGTIRIRKMPTAG